MGKRVYAILPVLLAVLLFSPLVLPAAADAVPGAVRIENRAYSGGVLSFDALLSGGNGQSAPDGQLAVCVYGEDRRLKDSAFYPAAELVQVRLNDVSDTDRVKAVWLDGVLRPQAEPATLLMDRTDAKANAQFANDLVKLLDRYEIGAGAEAIDPFDPYAMARLIVGCDTLPDLADWPVTGSVRGPGGLWVLQFQSSVWAGKCAAYLMEQPGVRYVEPDVMIQTDEPTAEGVAELSDASGHLSWGVDACGLGEYAESLASRGFTGGVTVAVVDSGVDLGHPFLSGRLLPGYDILDGDDDPQDQFGHGTHVAGIIADCTTGLDVKILPVRVLNEWGKCYSMALASAAIRYAADQGVDVINLSLGAPASQCIDDAVRYALSKNITVVSAAGNQSADTEHRSPARVKDAVTVSAVGEANKRFPLSNYGDAVSLCAPGELVKSAYLRESGEAYKTLSGTSMSAPHVSAAAALLLCEHRNWTPVQISTLLQSAAKDLGDSGWDKYFGAGLLDMRDFIKWPEGIYALLYSDGELVFQTSPTPVEGRTLKKAYQVGSASGVGAEYMGWYDQRETVMKVTFAEKIQPESTALWFYGFTKLTAIEGLENLDLSSVKNMSQMFAGCEKLTVLDLTVFDTANVTDMRKMFFDCAALKTIYTSDKFSIQSVTESADMFYGCRSLEGRRGTKYDDTHTDKEYARMDGGPSAPGYFRPKTVPVESVALNAKSIQMDKGQTAVLTATISPEDATDKTITWNSDKPSIVDVTGNGRVIAVASGKAEITASSGGKSDTCAVTVRVPGEPRLSSYEITVPRYGERTLTAVVVPDDATNKNIAWSSNNPETAKITTSDNTSAVIKGIKDGDTEIVAKVDGVEKSCKVRVYTHWSDWSDNPPPADAPEKEERMVYRYRKNTKETKTSTSPSLSGYTLTGSSKEYGAWTDWGDTTQYPSDTLEVETRQVVDVPAHTEYRYGRWLGATINWCKEYGESLHGGVYSIQYSDWSSSRATDTGTNWCCGHFDWEHSSHIGVIGNDSRGYPMWRKYQVSGYTNPEFFWEETRNVGDTYKKQYRSRTVTTIYYYERWIKGPWSDWTTEYRDVDGIIWEREEKKQYRYVIIT